MRIAKLITLNWGTIDARDWPLADATLLTGESGSGKSTLLDAMQAVLTDEFETLQTAVNSALGALGADIRAMELQTDFLIEISDATEEGLGSIVDADMARESARLTSLQIRQQLGVQVSGIANKSPQALLALFQ